jgi:Na+/melibiose symporter-like transporter
MKYTIAAILIASTLMLIWAYRSGGTQFALIMAVALAAISLCGMLPVLFSIHTRKRDPSISSTEHNANQVVVHDDDTTGRNLP